MYLKKFFLAIVALMGYAVAMSAQAPSVLKGHVEGSPKTKVVMLYDQDGDAIANETETDANGDFQFSNALPTQTKDAFLYISGKPYGAFLENGKTVEMTIQESDVTFSGDNVPENDYVNTYQQAFFSNNYKPTPDETYDYGKSMEKLQSNYNKVMGKIDAIKPEMRANAKDLADKYKAHYTLLLMRLDRDNDHSAESAEIISNIDQNSDNTRLTGLLNDWYNSANLIGESQKEATSMPELFAKIFQKIDGALTNEGNKKNLYNSMGQMYMMYQPSEEDVNAFFAAVEPQIGKYDLLKKTIMEAYESMKPKVNNGDAFPTDPILIAPDGTTCKLSDLIGKNVVYIDIWATWCRPCCAEIPYLDKLVERFKGNDKVSFISISQDSEKDKWLRKVAKDNPQWPQYIFDPKTGEEFLNEMGINAIPRFIIVGKDGKILSVDAERPSNENIDEILNKASE